MAAGGACHVKAWGLIHCSTSKHRATNSGKQWPRLRVFWQEIEAWGIRLPTFLAFFKMIVSGFWWQDQQLYLYGYEMMANTLDVSMTSELLHGGRRNRERRQHLRWCRKAGRCNYRNKSGKKIRYQINRRPSQIKNLSKAVSTRPRNGNTQNRQFVAKSNMFSGWWRVFWNSRRSDTEACENRLPNSISCLRWRIWFWLTGLALRLDSVCLAKGNRKDFHTKSFIRAQPA